MFIINLYRFICGYVEILAYGDFASKLLNIFALKKITIWNIKRNADSIAFHISVRNFLRLREIKGKLKIKIKIVKKIGLYFLIKKRVSRVGILIGVVLFFVTLQLFASRIWIVKVEGNKTVSTDKIISCCAAVGVKEGILRNKVRSQNLREMLLLECEELAWCSFNVEGSKLTVNVTEVSSKANSDPSNIVADCDGVITEILVESGVALLKKGDPFCKGDILISGIENEGNTNRFINSSGKIKAKIAETLVEECAFSAENYYENGNTTKKHVIEFFSVKLPLFIGETKGDYFTTKTKKELKIFGETLPIKLYTRTFNFLQVENVQLSRESALEKLNVKINEKLKALPENFEIISREINENSSGIKLKCEVRYEKFVGIEEKLNFDIPK